ncbi:MAG: hypothetical protein KA955_09720 [Prevotella sp.]|nr:hypothetical protein [Prevotella sp.]
MAYNTYRTKDMEAERELSKYLDKYLYSKAMFSRAERTDNASTQIDGSDIIVSIPSLNIRDAVVDEKASIYYINKDLRTFVLELSFLNRGLNYNEGWFVDNRLATEYYLMQWIKADIADPWMVKDHNIKEIECVLVSKKKLQKYFEEQGLTHEKLKEITEHMRKDSSYRAPYNPEFRFYYSPQLAEKPINILLNKEVYIRLGEFHYFVTPN